MIKVEFKVDDADKLSYGPVEVRESITNDVVQEAVFSVKNDRLDGSEGFSTGFIK